MASLPSFVERSLDGPATSSRRRWQRLPTVFRTTKVFAGGSQGLARIQNISDGGMCIASSMRLRLRSAVIIEMAEGLRLSGVVVWRREFAAGVMFDAPVDCRSLLTQATQVMRRRQESGHVLRLRIPIEISVDGSKHSTILSELSLTAAKVASVGKLREGHMVHLSLRPGQQIKAFVHSFDGDCAKLLFCTLLTMEQVGCHPTDGEEDQSGSAQRLRAAGSGAGLAA